MLRIINCCATSYQVVLLAIIGAFALQGCKTYQYVPTPNYIPLHDKKNEIRGNATLSSLQASYSVSENLFVASSVFWRNRKDTWGTGKEHGGGWLGYEKSRDLSIAMGYYRPSNKVRFEVLGGVGFGTLEYRNEVDLYPPQYNFNLECARRNYFIQPNVGYKWHNAEIGFSIRMNYLNLRNIDSELTIEPNYRDRRDEYLFGKENVNLLFLDPAFIARAGGKVKFHVLVGGARSLNSFPVRSKNLYMSMGVSLALDVSRKTD